MRTLAIGDIHGCLRAFDTLLEMVSPTLDDTLVTLGDYVDRGPDSRGVIERLLSLEKFTQFVPLRGNHEEMMCAARDGRADLHFWMRVGGDETVASYGVPIDPFDLEQDGEGLRNGVPQAHWDFLFQRCGDAYETDDHIFVHAGVVPDKPLDAHARRELLWPKFQDRGPHQSGKRVICGHTPQHNGIPLNVGHTVVVDTWVYDLIGWLTCFDVESGHYWQANQQGDRREGNLTETPA